MKSVRINTNELFQIVEDNKVKHAREYIEAVKDYKDAVLTIAANNFEIAETQDTDEFKKLKRFPNPPTSYEHEYDRALKMLDLSVDDITELDSNVFNQLVLDEWGWKDSFTALNASYKSFNG